MQLLPAYGVRICGRVCAVMPKNVQGRPAPGGILKEEG